MSLLRFSSISWACWNLFQAKDPDHATTVLPPRLPRGYRTIWAFTLFIFLAMILVALHMTSRPKFKLWPTCAPWQTNSAQHACRSVLENAKYEVVHIFICIVVIIYVLLYVARTSRLSRNPLRALSRIPSFNAPLENCRTAIRTVRIAVTSVRHRPGENCQTRTRC